jgi:RNA polymerase sigma-70 factor (ECF subfamily)
MGAGIQDTDTEGFVRGCLEDDREAAEAFFIAFNPRLVRLLRRRVGDLLVAEDLAQETLIRALDSLDRIDPARPLWPWLKAIALNLAKDNARRSKREVPCYEISRGMPDEADRCDQAIMLEQALGALPGRHRAALSLRYLNDWKPSSLVCPVQPSTSCSYARGDAWAWNTSAWSRASRGPSYCRTTG